MSLRVKQASLRKSMERALKRSKDLSGKPDIRAEEIEIQIAHLKERYAEFCDIQHQVEAVCAADELEQEFGNREQSEEYYFAAISNLKTLLRQHLSATSTHNAEAKSVDAVTQHHSHEIPLPRIKIPVFDGNYGNWTEFEGLFTDLIDKNQRLTNSQKLHYLKANLTGEAATLLRTVQISDANYQEAWRILTNRYNHRRFIIDSHLRRFRNMPAALEESALGLRNIIDTTTDTIRSLKVLAVPVVSWDIVLINIVVDKLDPETHRQWELTLNRTQYPTYQGLMEFLETRWQSLEMISMSKSKSSTLITSPSSRRRNEPASTRSSITIQSSSSRQTKRGSPSQLPHSFVVTSTNSLNCPFCSEVHSAFQCDKFKSLTFDHKSKLIRERNLCFNCLRKGHRSAECRSSLCQICNRRHHTLLHIPEGSSRTPVINTSTTPSDNSATDDHAVEVRSHQVASPLTDVLLATAVGIVANGNQEFAIRALLDSGSQVNLISENATTRIGLRRKPASISINGIGAREATKSQSIVEFVLKSRIDPRFSIAITAVVVERITGILPSQYIESHHWKHLDELQLADPQFNPPHKIDILLGADVLGMIQMDGRAKSLNGSPFAQETKLGHILFGRFDRSTSTHSLSTTAIIEDYTIVDNTLKSFWEIENVPESRELTADEIQCEAHFQSTHSRTNEGRYIVQLPFVDKPLPLGTSREGAIVRLKHMEHRFRRNPQLCTEYRDFMQAYLDQGHMEAVPVSYKEHTSQTCYLPHHGVIQGSISRPKLRVVFDASHKTTSGNSLNHNLRIGPKLQQNLFNILTRFRQHKFVFIADIRQMYRQILVAPEHQDYQRIVWRARPEDPIQDFRLRTVTYGTSCAPYLAMRTLHQLAQDESEQFPIAAKIALTDFYVDDLMTGTTEVKDLLEIQQEMVSLLQRGGFELRKWSSNCQALLDQVSSEYHEHRPLRELSCDESVKALGLQWAPSGDYFAFKIENFPELSVITKRIILSEASRVFDPLGWLSPCIIIAKIIFQELWVLGLSWDEEVPKSIAERWSNYRKNLGILESRKINRWTGRQTCRDQTQIHGFSDASMKAYAAVVYARVTSEDGSVKITILAAKTKVAPLKTVSLPRLELCASVLLAKIMHKIVQLLDLNDIELFAWTDSQVVLGWLRSPPSRWKTFVANRVSQILDYLPPSAWRYVETRHNPADCGSRGLEPSLLHDNHIWWRGPEWLSKHPDTWPKHKINDCSISLEECRVTSMVTMHTNEPPNFDGISQLLDRCSTFGKLLRVTSYCRRYLKQFRIVKDARNHGFITVPEMNWARDFWVRYVQSTYFADEINRCQSGEHLSNKSALISLHPFVDKDGILRVGGRLRHSLLPYQGRHPIILPRSSKLTELIIAQAHRTTLHGGQQLMLAHLRSHYWIINAKKLVQAHVRQCVTCFRYRSTTGQQLMANLPAPRVTPSRAFLHSGVDYAGPITMKLSKGRSTRSTKGYICLFVCLSTKAIHLEMVSDLTASAFIASFQRFTARRGKVQALYSDQGTNFIGANRQLVSRHHHSTNVDPEIAAMLAQDNTTWCFNPPASPHFGGLWEAGVKSVKHHLRRITGTALLTFEEMTTVLCQIEACINSRPLCPMSDDPEDCTALTPGHFLIGESLITVPEPSMLDIQSNRLNRYQHTQQMYQHFWRVWSTEYLSRLQQRPKWLQSNVNFAIGQLVLIKNELLPPAKWAMGRIIATHPGADGLIRTVTLKCQGTTFTRPVVKLCLLPIPDNIPH